MGARLYAPRGFTDKGVPIMPGKRRAFLRALILSLPAGLALAACRHWQEGDYSRTQQTRDGGGGGGSGGGGGGGDGGDGGGY